MATFVCRPARLGAAQPVPPQAPGRGLSARWQISAGDQSVCPVRQRCQRAVDGRTNVE